MNEALRYNEGKAELAEILQFDNALEALAKVMSQGGVKYEHRNWLKGGKPDAEYLNSALRHLLSFEQGEFYDQDTGCAHIAHVAWNMLALLRLNHHDAPVLDPEFDQQEYLDRYSEPTLEETRAKWDAIAERTPLPLSQVMGEPPYDPTEWVNKRVVTTLGADVWVRSYDATRERYLVEGFGGEQYMTDISFDPIFDG